MTQVIDFIGPLLLLEKWAKKPWRRRINQLARLLAGCTQSYPQMRGTDRKVPVNQQLGGIPSHHVEVKRLTRGAGAA
jgi:hypothetical protein